MRRLWARVDERLVAPGPGFRVAEIQILLAAVIALRLATRDWTQIAERPAALRDGLTVMSWYTGTPPSWALVAVQVVGLACALLVFAQRRPRLAFAGLWIAYTALTALWGSREGHAQRRADGPGGRRLPVRVDASRATAGPTSGSATAGRRGRRSPSSRSSTSSPARRSWCTAGRGGCSATT